VDEHCTEFHCQCVPLPQLPLHVQALTADMPQGATLGLLSQPLTQPALPTSQLHGRACADPQVCKDDESSLTMPGEGGGVEGQRLRLQC
jgi:hypothetical protein